MQLKIAFFDAKSYDKEFFDSANKSFGFEIHYIDRHLTRETAILAKGCQAVCIFVNDQASAEVIDLLHQNGVRLIALRCAGYNNVDLNATAGKMKVVRVPAYSPAAVAEFTIALMLCLNRGIHLAYSRIKENNFSIAGLLGFDMHGKTAGIIGYGQIGAIVVRILKGFGMRVLVYDIDAKRIEKAGERSVDLATLFKESDIISLHCPLTPESAHMINASSIAQMKTGAMLINTGRGGLINTTDLIAALKSKKIGSAGLDVYEEESHYFYEDFSSSFISDDALARLQTFPNVLITSHQAFFTKEAMHNISHITLQSIADFAQGKPLANEILK